MQYVLNITERCNFRCTYCPQTKTDADMDFSTARSIVDYAYNAAVKRGERDASLSFYGGEPLLRKDWIKSVIAYAAERYEKNGFYFRYRMTTNGALLDDDFLHFTKEAPFRIALSIDGHKEAHDSHRRAADGSPTHEKAESAAKRLLSLYPGSAAMATVNPDTAPMLFDSVRHLYALGFRQIVTTLNHLAAWTDGDIAILKVQYTYLAQWYGDVLESGERLSLPLFDAKLMSHLTPQIARSKCEPGRHRLHFDISGGIFPCTQYSYHLQYRLGSAMAGVDENALEAIRCEASFPVKSCLNCALSSRCDNQCGCKNLETTGSVRAVSPLVCAHERMLIPIADALGNRVLR